MLLKINSFAPSIMRLYAKYLLEITNDTENYDKIMNKLLEQSSKYFTLIFFY
jgi:hypothetical protein